MPAVRHHRSITSLSWIPSEAVEGSTRLAFEAGLAHYDDPPPEVIEDLQALCAEDRFRFANALRAWVETDASGHISDCGGERAHLEGGERTSTLVAVTPCRVASVEARELDRGALQEISKGHRRTPT